MKGISPDLCLHYIQHHFLSVSNQWLLLLHAGNSPSCTQAAKCNPSQSLPAALLFMWTKHMTRKWDEHSAARSARHVLTMQAAGKLLQRGKFPIEAALRKKRPGGGGEKNVVCSINVQLGSKRHYVELFVQCSQALTSRLQ